jgi:hypothetical protein
MEPSQKPGISNKFLIQKLIPFAVVGLIVGITIEMLSEHPFSINEPPLAWMTIVFSVIAILVAIMILLGNLANGQNYSHKLKRAIDILAICLIVLWISCPWWLFFGYEFHIVHGHFPIPLIVFMADGVPAILSYWWLAIRFYEKHPRLLSGNFVKLTLLLFLGLPLLWAGLHRS